MCGVHQLVHTLSYGDAISGEVRAIRHALHNAQVPSEIYAINTHPRYQGETVDYRQLPVDTTDSVILHYSLGSPLNPLYQGLTGARRSLIYHNMTPPQWFRSVNPRVVSDLVQGHAELPVLAGVSDQLIADSTFNAKELADLGFAATVLPLPVGGTRWGGEANAGITSLLARTPALHLLHVGRLAPNKCIEDILKVFYFIHHYVEPNSKLWLVGIDTDTEVYSFHLKRFAAELGVRDAVMFTGGRADEEVRAFYRGSSVYLGMSEHEGFCLPIVEAMAEGLPVVAFAAGAVPETMGNAGVLVREKRHAEIAEVIGRIYRDTAFKHDLVTAGRKRAQDFGEELFAPRVLELFGDHRARTLSQLARESA